MFHQLDSGDDTDTDFQCASSSAASYVLETATPSRVTSEDPESKF